MKLCNIIDVVREVLSAVLGAVKGDLRSKAAYLVGVAVAKGYIIDKGVTTIQISPFARNARPSIRSLELGFKFPALPCITLKSQDAFLRRKGWHFLSVA